MEKELKEIIKEIFEKLIEAGKSPCEKVTDYKISLTNAIPDKGMLKVMGIFISFEIEDEFVTELYVFKDCVYIIMNGTDDITYRSQSEDFQKSVLESSKDALRLLKKELG